MAQAYILIQTEVGRAVAVSATVSEIAGVTKAEPVTGPYDVIVHAEATDVEELSRSVLARVQKVPGITRTLSCPLATAS